MAYVFSATPLPCRLYGPLVVQGRFSRHWRLFYAKVAGVERIVAVRGARDCSGAHFFFGAMYERGQRVWTKVPPLELVQYFSEHADGYLPPSACEGRTAFPAVVFDLFNPTHLTDIRLDRLFDPVRLRNNFQMGLLHHCHCSDSYGPECLLEGEFRHNSLHALVTATYHDPRALCLAYDQGHVKIISRAPSHSTGYVVSCAILVPDDSESSSEESD